MQDRFRPIRQGSRRSTTGLRSIEEEHCTVLVPDPLTRRQMSSVNGGQHGIPRNGHQRSKPLVTKLPSMSHEPHDFMMGPNFLTGWRRTVGKCQRGILVSITIMHDGHTLP